jgi:hypothetical protein
MKPKKTKKMMMGKPGAQQSMMRRPSLRDY